MKWINISEEGDTYPPEGITVLISDGENYDTAYYIRSGEYYWIKVNVKNDDYLKFDDFNVIKWAFIEE